MSIEPNIAADFSLADRVAVITGGTGVIGRALTSGLVAAGSRVAILGRRLDRLEADAAAITHAGGEAIGIVADVTDESTLRAARDQVLERWGRVDILVNAAGGNVAGATLIPDAAAWAIPIDGWRDVVTLNLLGTVLPIQVFAEAMARPGVTTDRVSWTASIVNVSSMAAGPVLTRVGAYGAAKAAVENVTRWFAVELARRHGPGLRVNAIAPGFVLQSAIVPSAEWERLIGRVPLKRPARTEEITSALEFLMDNEYVTGQTIVVDGGYSLL